MELINNNQVPEGYKKTEVGVIPEDWDVDRIASLTSISTGSRNTQDRVNDGQYPFFVRSQIVERINSYSFDGEAVLTAGDGVGTGKVFHYINGKFDIHQRVYKISNFKSELNGLYFYKYFSNHFYDRIMSMTAKSSVDSVRMEMIANMLIPLPSPKEQKAIAQTLSDVDVLIAALDKLIAKKRNIKTGTMQQLLTGKTRLPGFGEGKGYKKTEVGVIPEDWNWIPLKLVCKVNQGLQIAIEKRLKNQNGQAKRYITIQSLNSDANLEYIDNYASSVVCNEEDILMTRTGNTGIVITGVSGVFHNNFFKVKFDKSKIDNYYEQNTARNHQTRISSLNRFFRSR